MSFHIEKEANNKEREKAPTKQKQQNNKNTNLKNTQPGRGMKASEATQNVATKQLVCPVLSRSSIEATEGQGHQHHRMNRQVPSKKVAMQKPGIPPARIPEIAKRGRAGMTSTNAY